MRQVELKGAPGPLVSQLEKVWEVSDADADVSLLLTTPFLFSDGKALLAMAPKRLASRLRDLLEVDTRALLVQTRFEPTWFIEAQLVGPSEREAPRLSDQLRQKIVGAPTAIEDWFVSEQPHPYWRSLAIRYPQMLRALAEQARFGIERGCRSRQRLPATGSRKQHSAFQLDRSAGWSHPAQRCAAGSCRYDD